MDVLLYSRLRYAALVLAMFACCGCWTSRVQWSPDGQAAVVLADAAYLMDERGSLRQLEIPEGAYKFAWLPDSRGFVVARRRTVRDAASLEAALGCERTDRLTAAAEAIWRQLSAGVPMDDVATDIDIFSSAADAVSIILWERHGDWMRQHFPDEADEPAAVEIEGLLTATLRGDRLEPGRLLWDGLASISIIRVAPDGGAVAFVTQEDTLLGTGGDLRINVVRTDGSGDAEEVAEHTSEDVTWLPDSRSLVYLEGQHFEWKYTLGWLKMRTVLGEGRVETPPSYLATVIFTRDASVQSLGDGRVMFNAVPFRLPSTSYGPEQLFILNVNRPEGSLEAMIPAHIQAGLPESLSLFEASPDGRQVLVPGSEGDIFLIDLSEARTEAIRQSLPNDTGHHVPLPAWRRAGEFTFLRQGVSRNELVLRSGSEENVLSRCWPDIVLKRLTK